MVKNVQQYLKAIYQTADCSDFRSLMEFPQMLWLFYQVRYHTMIDIPRLKSLYRITKEVDSLKLSGDIIECGVFCGGSAAVMAYATIDSSVERDIWLFDSFEGLPKPTKEDGQEALRQLREGWNKGDIIKVKQIFEKKKIPKKRIHIVKGWFQETFSSIDIPRIAILHIDADWYESVKLCLNKFYDSVEPGGYIVIDDYCYWEGARIATDEFIKNRGLKAARKQADSTSYYLKKA
ncbi:class I SAM-dependent methyltransferase [Patescibacteria group bacterium]|nr:class I SAM-dependent methyltransferase [Patescibacteria group bacterium]